MNESLIYRTDTWLLCLILFIAMILMVWLGTRLRAKRVEEASLSTIEGSLFGLLGLLLAFTFSMSASRYDARKAIMVEEANDIGTALLRADMYTDSLRTAFRKDFQHYIKARIAYYDAGRDTALINVAKRNTETISAHIWYRAIQASHKSENLAATQQMIPALNAMIDAVTLRTAAGKSRVPDSIIVLLFLLSLSCSFFAGYVLPGNKKMGKTTILGFVLLTVFVIYVILDLDRPRRGIINMDEQQQYFKALLVDLEK
jgi:hypothetical protein